MTAPITAQPQEWQSAESQVAQAHTFEETAKTACCPHPTETSSSADCKIALASADELSGILNEALEGVRRIYKRGFKFKRPEAVSMATEQWLTEANPLPAFLKECCIIDPSKKCTLQDFYAKFTSWSMSKGYTYVQQAGTVSRNVQHLGFKQVRRNNGQTFLGLCLKSQ